MITQDKVKAGSTIFLEGAWEMLCYVIKTGKVGIYAKYGTPEEKLLVELGPGKIFGEMGLVEAKTRSASAVALEDTELTKFDSASLADFLEKEPATVMAILQNMSGRLRELSGQYLEAAETVAEVLEAENKKKPSLPERIMMIIAIGDEFAASADYLESGMDYLYYHNGARFM